MKTERENRKKFKTKPYPDKDTNCRIDPNGHHIVIWPKGMNVLQEIVIRLFDDGTIVIHEAFSNPLEVKAERNENNQWGSIKIKHQNA